VSGTVHPFILHCRRLSLDLELRDESIKHVFSHPSFTNEQRQAGLHSNDYERLEFLGDSVVNLCITKKLYDLFPKDSEGNLSKLRSALVSEQELYHLSQELNLGDFIFYGKGEKQLSGRRSVTKIHTRVFEALMGALFLDKGILAVQHFLDQLIRLFEVQQGEVWPLKDKILALDVKSKAQELVHSVTKENPIYRCLSPEGKDVLEMEFVVGGLVLTKAEGSVKKVVERALAQEVVRCWGVMKEKLTQHLAH
jgi:ribonuclease-3